MSGKYPKNATLVTVGDHAAIGPIRLGASRRPVYGPAALAPAGAARVLVLSSRHPN
jgi:hypothetical protein